MQHVDQQVGVEPRWRRGERITGLCDDAVAGRHAGRDLGEFEHDSLEVAVMGDERFQQGAVAATDVTHPFPVGEVQDAGEQQAVQARASGIAAWKRAPSSG